MGLVARAKLSRVVFYWKNQMKKCPKCKEKKSREDFYKKTCSKDGLAYSCKDCSKSYNEANKEHKKATNKKYYDDHREAIGLSKDAYRDTHQEEIKAYKKKYYATEAGKASRKRTLDKYPNATKCRTYYANHKSGLIITDHCEDCGKNKKVEGHHWDYNLPMDVSFLCIDCHRNWHRLFIPENRETGIFTEKNSEL